MAKTPMPGELRHTVTIETPTSTTQDTHGQPVVTWSSVMTVYARIETLSGRLAEYARQMVQTATHRVTVRYTPSLTHKCRFDFRGRKLDIGHVENIDERDEWLVCTCTEVL